MQKASELTIKQIETILEGMNWTEIHKARVFGDYGDKVVLYTDGEFSVQGQSTYYRNPDEAGVICYLNCWGRGNIDTTPYQEGWLKPHTDEDGLETGDYVIAFNWDAEENGTILTSDQVIEQAIEDGDWDDAEEIDAVIESIQQERREARFYA